MNPPRNLNNRIGQHVHFPLVVNNLAKPDQKNSNLLNPNKRGLQISLPTPQKTIMEHLINYPTPINLNYLWSFGSLSGMFFLIQVISGIFLAMHYTPHIDYAFDSVEHIMREVNYGWFLRYTHSNGASFFFIMVYIHIGKALYYQSYTFPYLKLWRIGILIFLLMMATAFLGHVLPWGQMSFWGATVITNLFTAIPFIGQPLVYWIWGGFSVENATLNRFFSLHYLLPFVIAGFILLHLVLLHIPGSSNPLKISDMNDKIPFYPYYYLKDLNAFIWTLVIFLFVIANFPNYLGHPDNYIPANPLSTPKHIVPEWYFLPFYAILRSIPDKLQGVIFMGLSIVYLFFLPNHRYFFVKLFYKYNPNTFVIYKNPDFRPTFKFFFWCFVCNFILLGWIGAKPVEDPYIQLGQIATFFHFFYFFLSYLSIFLDHMPLVTKPLPPVTNLPILYNNKFNLKELTIFPKKEKNLFIIKSFGRNPTIPSVPAVSSIPPIPSVSAIPPIPPIPSVSAIPNNSSLGI
jgi:ubiquinol-cytochrome c reductase cytochrome b subunit